MTGNQGSIPEREPEKWLPHPRKAAGAQITQWSKTEVVTIRIAVETESLSRLSPKKGAASELATT